MITSLRPGGALSYAAAVSPLTSGAPPSTSGAASAQASMLLFMHLNSLVDTSNEPSDARTLQGVVPDHAPASPNPVTIQPGRVVNANFSGFGAEYNPHLYDPSGPLFNKAGGTADETLHRDVSALGLERTRIIFNGDDLDEGGTSKLHQEQYQSLVKTLEMAKANHTDVNLTWAGGLRMKDGLTGGAREHAQQVQNQHIGQIADMLDSFHKQGLTNIKSITLENEPGIPWKNDMPEYAHIYKQLDSDLKARGIRQDYQLIGGDLTSRNPNNPALLQQIAKSLGDTLDGISFHVYWSATDKTGCCSSAFMAGVGS